MGERIWWTLLGMVLTVAIVGSVAWVFIKMRRVLLARAEAFLKQLFVEVAAVSEAREGFVAVHFPIYVGSLLRVDELAASAWVPHENVRKTVNSLALFSLKYGLVTLMAPYVVLMVLINYVLHVPKFGGRAKS